MLITTICPGCHKRYQVSETLRGQQIRCLNSACDREFVVGAEESPPAPPTTPPSTSSRPSGRSGGKNQRSGSVGDLVPILPAEEAVEPPPPAPAGSKKSGNVGDLIPLLEADAVGLPNEPPVVAPSWDEPPPVRSKPAAPAAPPGRKSTPADGERRKSTTARERPAPVEPPAPVKTNGASSGSAAPPSDQPRELDAGAWEAPPVRRSSDAIPLVEPEDLPRVEAVAAEPAPVAEAPPDEEERDVPVTRRFGMPVMICLVMLLLGFVGAGVFVLVRAFRENEERLHAEAWQNYKDRKWREAADKFGQLQQKYPQSERLEEYRLIQQLCDPRDRLEDRGVAPADAIGAVEVFLDHNQSSKPLKQHGRDLGESLVARLKDFSRQVPGTDPAAEEVVRRTQAVVDNVGLLPDALTADEQKHIDQELGKIRHAVALWHKRDEYLKKLRELVAQAGLDTVDRAKRLLQEAKDEGLTGFAGETEVVQMVQEIEKGVLTGVVYREEKVGERPVASKRREETLPSLVVTPLLEGIETSGSGEDGIELALARGVLYGLKRGKKGEVAWAMRVGADTLSLPVRLRRDATNPERILVLSADAGTLTALDENSNTVWEYALGAPCLGRPLIIDQRAFLGTYDGVIHEIELVGGKLLGRYELGAPGHRPRLTVGGARQGDSSLVYFPADDTCVYILDVDRKIKPALLYTNHPSGSLRGEPLVIPPEVAGAPAYLILNQAHGLDEMRLRAYRLPVTDAHTAPVELKVPPRVRGWSWFPPYQDGEKIALLSDAGVLGLFGIRQARNLDPALFPRFPAGPDGLNLAPFFAPLSVGGERERAQVVHVEDEDYWVLVHGRLQRLRLGWRPSVGPQLARVWEKMPELGSPLHASQYEEDVAGRAILYVVTQAQTRPDCLATAIRADSGDVLWQRQLGLVCQGEPVLVRPADGGGLGLLLVMDQGGGLHVFDPARYQKRELSQWEHGGVRLAKADSLEENRRFPPVLVADETGQGAWQIACPGRGTSLLVRRVGWAEGGRKLELKWEKRTALSGGVPAGPPARNGETLVVPLDSGVLIRLTLSDDKDRGLELEPGPNWRLARLGPETPGYVTALGGDRFLTYDGAYGVKCWSWPVGQSFVGLPRQTDPRPRKQLPPTLTLPEPLAAAPLPVPAGPMQRPRVCLADAAGRLTLVEQEESGKLTRVRSWDLKGRITAGPFVRAAKGGTIRIGCVVDGGRLVYLDPEKDEPLWQHGQPGEVLVGLPQLVDNVLVLAYQSGRFELLIEQTGQPRGKGYELRGNIAPVVSPVAFGPGLTFAPLSDGTVLLLPVEQPARP